MHQHANNFYNKMSQEYHIIQKQNFFLHASLPRSTYNSQIAEYVQVESVFNNFCVLKVTLHCSNNNLKYNISKKPCF